MRQEVDEFRQALEDCKVTERTKGLIKQYSGAGEEEASHRLQRVASYHNRTLAEAAQSIVEASEVLHQLEQAGSAKSSTGTPVGTRKRG